MILFIWEIYRLQRKSFNCAKTCRFLRIGLLGLSLLMRSCLRNLVSFVMEVVKLSNLKQKLKWVNLLNRQCQNRRVHVVTTNKTNSNPQVRESGATKNEGLKRGLQTMESYDCQMSESSMFLFVRSSFRFGVICVFVLVKLSKLTLLIG